MFETLMWIRMNSEAFSVRHRARTLLPVANTGHCLKTRHRD